MDTVPTPLSISLTAVLAAAVDGGARPGLLQAVCRPPAGRAA